MNNSLKISQVSIINSKTILVEFTEKLSTNLRADNFSVNSMSTNVVDAEIQSISISDNKATLNILPLIQLSAYKIVAKSTDIQPFVSYFGNLYLQEDGIANEYIIVSQVDPEDPVKKSFIQYLQGSIYNIEDPNNQVLKYIDGLSSMLTKAWYDVRQLKNENYISIDIVDEQKSRGAGATDRLNEESAYEIVRLSKFKSDYSSSKTISVNNFIYPVSLQQDYAEEDISLSSLNKKSSLNLDEYILNLSDNILYLDKIVFTKQNNPFTIEYSKTKYGYQIKSNIYDKDFASKYLTLSENQIKLNEEFFVENDLNKNNIFSIKAYYYFKNDKLIPDNNSVLLSEVNKQVREVVEPLLLVFDLKNSNIVDFRGKLIALNGVTFSDFTGKNKHPAFLYEIPYRLDNLPSSAGQYCVDYTNGKVFVFGELLNDGTGANPPLATYYYKKTFKDTFDFSHDKSRFEVIPLQYGSSFGRNIEISFSYDYVLVNGKDYKCVLHKEVLQEEVKNKLIATNAVRANKKPITNVFSVFNETTGETYPISRWNDDRIYFTYLNPPKVSQLFNEISTMLDVSEYLYVNKYIIHNTSRIIVFSLLNQQVVSQKQNLLGTFKNSSIKFSEDSVFKNEIYYNIDVSLEDNLDRLYDKENTFFVDYENGLIYLCLQNDPEDFGNIYYKINKIVTQNKNLLTPTSIYNKIDFVGSNIKSYEYTNFDDLGVYVKGLSPAITNKTSNGFPYFLLNNQVSSTDGYEIVNGVDLFIGNLYAIYESTDFLNNKYPITFDSFIINDNKTITLFEQSYSENYTVSSDGYELLIVTNKESSYLSNNIDINFSVKSISSGIEYKSYSTLNIVNDKIVIKTSLDSGLIEGEDVAVNISFTIKNLSSIYIDYDFGNLFIDYSYLSDTLLINYEYGENEVDFSISNSISENEEYYVSYRVGALREALISNFASLINIKELSNVDIYTDRERYRDVLSAALASFIQGPTTNAIKNIAKTISHIDPEIIEGYVEQWVLNNNFLYGQEYITSNDFDYMPGKYGQVAIFKDESYAKITSSGNFSWKEGTFEARVIPMWNGIDNKSNLTFEIKKDGYLINTDKIFIGKFEQHPTTNKFVIDNNLIEFGKPNINKDGVYIYQDKDEYGVFNNWKLEILDGYSSSYGSYEIEISSNGSFYNLIADKDSTTRTFKNKIKILNDLLEQKHIKYSWISDTDKVLFFVGNKDSKQSINLFKSINGDINFVVTDKFGTKHKLSSNVSNWVNGDSHTIAISWKLGSEEKKDAIRLFIDGKECENKIKFGQYPIEYAQQVFNTIAEDRFLNNFNKEIVGSIDLKTISGSNKVTSSIDFSAYNIQVGDVLYIEESIFNPSGYLITNVNGQELTVSNVFSYTLDSLKYSVNKKDVETKIKLSVFDDIEVICFELKNNLSTFTNIVSGTNELISSIDLLDFNVVPGDYLKLDTIDTLFTITSIDNNIINVYPNINIDYLGSLDGYIYNKNFKILNGLKSEVSDYSISDLNDPNKSILTIRNGVTKDSIVVIRTFGLNQRNIVGDYYVWSDGYENTLRTNLATPISIDEVSIIKQQLQKTLLDTSNGNYVGLNYSADILLDPLSGTNKKITIKLNGTNIDFTTPVQVTLVGDVSETLAFNAAGVLTSTLTFNDLTNVQVSGEAKSSTRPFGTLEIEEELPMTYDDGYSHPKIYYSYILSYGKGSANGMSFTSDDLFSKYYEGCTLHIFEPINLSTKIISVSSDGYELLLEDDIGDVLNCKYNILQTKSERNGLQEGLFTFEYSDSIIPYMLRRGNYKFRYTSYLSIPINYEPTDILLGNSIELDSSWNGGIEQIKITKNRLTDLKKGQLNVGSNLTTDFESISKWKVDDNTLLLSSFDAKDFTVERNIYPNKIQYLVSNYRPNDNFGKSILLDKGLSFENNGYLNGKSEGVIEFWYSPFIDTGNNPNKEVLFDASSLKLEEVYSDDFDKVSVSSPIESVLFVKEINSKNDYFCGGKIDYYKQNSTLEETTSLNSMYVTTSKEIYEVISVTVSNDPKNKNYFTNGSVSKDRKKIFLGTSLPTSTTQVKILYVAIGNNNVKTKQFIKLNKKLPYGNTKVVVGYIPKGYQGDRISIYKDNLGFINFLIRANQQDYLVSGITRWEKSTWHKIKSIYKFDNINKKLEMRLFLDGYQYNSVHQNETIYLDDFVIPTNSNFIGDGYSYLNKFGKFNDDINTIHLGKDSLNNYFAKGLINNLRISNKVNNLVRVGNEYVDISYSNNNSAIPLQKDLYTTFLLNLDVVPTKSTDYAKLKNKISGQNDFTINVYDDLDLIKDNQNIDVLMKKLLNVLKPASSRMFLNFK